MLHGRFGAAPGPELLLGIEAGAGIFQLHHHAHGAGEGPLAIGREVAQRPVGLGAVHVGFLFQQQLSVVGPLVLVAQRLPKHQVQKLGLQGFLLLPT